MKIGIVGLGLVGSSIARAMKAFSENKVYAHDKDGIILEAACLGGVVDGVLDDSTLEECEAVFVALYPGDTVEYVKNKRNDFKKDSVVIDCCGIKRDVCGECFEIARENGFNFVGGHPMAGGTKGGYKYGKSTLFKGATMIIVPPTNDDPELLRRTFKILEPIGFSKIIISNATKHDRVIAHTSQLAHVVSNAYVKSPASSFYNGYSAGSYKDMTRVAELNSRMWTELFMRNRDNLAEELDLLIGELSKYRDALKSENSEMLEHLLLEGAERKRSL